MQQRNNKISLLISGNQFRSAGFQPIIATGQYMLQLTYQGYPGMDTTPYYYVLRITPDYTQYTLVHNNVTSADGVSGMMLKIAVAIPAGTRLQNGMSVYTLLDEIREAFTTLYMDPTLGVEGGFTYKRSLPDKAVFEEILSRYPLESTYVRQCVNEGSRPGILVASRDTMELLFQDVQYQEFKPYSEVIVACEADCSYYEGRVVNELNNGMGIPIPPIRTFRLIINNREKRWPVADPFNERTAISSTKLYNLNPNEYEEERISFTINELLSGMGPSNVNIDVDNCVVSCTIQRPRPIQRPNPMLKPMPKPTELALSMKIRNCPVEGQSFPATLVIEGNGIHSQQYPVEFVRRNGYYTCSTTLDNRLVNQNVTITVLTNSIIEMATPVSRHLSQGANDITVEFDRYFKSPSNFAATINHYKKPILGLGLTIITLLLAGIIFLGVRGKKEATNPNNNGGGEKVVKNPVEKEEAKSLSDFIKESEKKLAEEDLTFKTVEQIDSIFKGYLEDKKYDKEREDLGDQVKEFEGKIGVYRDLVEIINKRTKDDETVKPLTQLRQIVNDKNAKNEEFKKIVNPIHQEYLRILFNGKTGVCTWNVGDSKYKNATAQYVNPDFEINSFKDFEKIVVIVKEAMDKGKSESATTPKPSSPPAKAPSKETTYKCKTCGAVFSDKGVYNNHIKTHTKRPDPKPSDPLDVTI